MHMTNQISRGVVPGTFAHVGVIEVCVVRPHIIINDPAVLIRNPHSDHRSAQD